MSLNCLGCWIQGNHEMVRDRQYSGWPGLGCVPTPSHKDRVGRGGPPRKSGAICTRRRKGVPDKWEYRTAALRGKRALHASCVAGMGQGPSMSWCRVLRVGYCPHVRQKDTAAREGSTCESRPAAELALDPSMMFFHQPPNPGQGQSPCWDNSH